MGKKSDKLYITHGEWSRDFGGLSAASQQQQRPSRSVTTWDLCALTLQPHQHPVCTLDGHIFDLENILPFLEKYHNIDPITGEPLSSGDLIRLHIHKNSAGKDHCPVTFKEFSPNSHIICIKTTGNVYSFDAVDRLNIKAKYWKDLLTDEPFKRGDIIHLQDPLNVGWRDVSKFHYFRTGKEFVKDERRRLDGSLGKDVKTSGMANRILTELAMKSSKESSGETKSISDTKDSVKERQQAHFSTGRAASSFTSTAIQPVTVNEPAPLDTDQVMYSHIKKNGYVQLHTNLGDLNLELYCQQVPLACHNFIMLCKTGYYNNVKFHRSIRNFMIQGGDPEGTGKGGESYWHRPFPDEFHRQLSHSQRGILSMANHGKDTNGSQLKHTVFGKIINGLSVLDRMESIPTDSLDKPIKDILMTGCDVQVDPFEEYHKQRQTQSDRKRKSHSEQEEPLESRRRPYSLSSSSVGRYISK